MKCPHCRKAELIAMKVAFPDWTHTCPECGRGWYQDKEGLWHSLFATDKETYSKNGKYLIERRY